ncbi:MAG: hypothetical protein JWO15_3673 [Sphingomonadales bacterium]|nr:hypothetical protein [Sphingomonadales bacterium]
MNLEKMRKQNHRNDVCGAKLSPGLDLPMEYCTLIGPHEVHNWPSLPKDPMARALMMIGSAGRTWTLGFSIYSEAQKKEVERRRNNHLHIEVDDMEMRGIDPRFTTVDEARRFHGFETPITDGSLPASTEGS